MSATESRAVIDIGSHSVLLLAAGGPEDLPEVLLEEYRITALGAGMSAGSRISADAAGLTRKVIQEYLDSCRSLNLSSIRLVGTAALRESVNQNEILEILSGPEKSPIEVLEQDQEATLTRAGALSGLNLEGSPDRAVVADLGGRSTEITWAGFSRSISLGCQRATDSHLAGDPPGNAEIARLEELLEAELSKLPAPPPGGRLIVSGGTSTTLASIDLALFSYRPEAIHGHPLSCRRLEELAQDLLSRPLAERRTLAGLEPDRAPVIPAGALILQRLCAWHPGAEVLVSARGLTWGVWLAMSRSPES